MENNTRTKFINEVNENSYLYPTINNYWILIYCLNSLAIQKDSVINNFLTKNRVQMNDCSISVVNKKIKAKLGLKGGDYFIFMIFYSYKNETLNSYTILKENYVTTLIDFFQKFLKSKPLCNSTNNEYKERELIKFLHKISLKTGVFFSCSDGYFKNEFRVLSMCEKYLMIEDFYLKRILSSTNGNYPVLSGLSTDKQLKFFFDKIGKRKALKALLEFSPYIYGLTAKLPSYFSHRSQKNKHSLERLEIDYVHDCISVANEWVETGDKEVKRKLDKYLVIRPSYPTKKGFLTYPKEFATLLMNILLGNKDFRIYGCDIITTLEKIGFSREKIIGSICYSVAKDMINSYPYHKNFR